MPTGAKFGGRTKGTLNRKTAESITRAERVVRLIESTYLEKDIKALTPGQRMMLFSDMLEYCSPKLSRQEVTGQDGGPQRFEITLKT